MRTLVEKGSLTADSESAIAVIRDALGADPVLPFIVGSVADAQNSKPKMRKEPTDVSDESSESDDDNKVNRHDDDNKINRHVARLSELSVEVEALDDHATLVYDQLKSSRFLVARADDGVGVAFWSHPSDPHLGDGRRVAQRFASFAKAEAEALGGRPAIHIYFIGHQGPRRLGEQLLRHILAAADEESSLVYLESPTQKENMYKQFGFEVRVRDDVEADASAADSPAPQGAPARTRFLAMVREPQPLPSRFLAMVREPQPLPSRFLAKQRVEPLPSRFLAKVRERQPLPSRFLARQREPQPLPSQSAALPTQAPAAVVTEAPAAEEL